MTNAYIAKYYASNSHFTIANPNPMWKTKRGLKWDRGDCAIRALANSISCEWLDAFDFLTRYARRDYNVVNDGGGVRKWLVEAGAKWNACKAIKGQKRMTCLDFAKEHPKGRYFIYVASHFTACVDGVLLDAFNPSDSAIVGYFDMSEFDINK